MLHCCWKNSATQILKVGTSCLVYLRILASRLDVSSLYIPGGAENLPSTVSHKMLWFAMCVWTLSNAKTASCHQQQSRLPISYQYVPYILYLKNLLVVSTPLKNISQIESFPQVGVKIKKWNHHPEKDIEFKDLQHSCPFFGCSQPPQPEEDRGKDDGPLPGFQWPPGLLHV